MVARLKPRFFAGGCQLELVDVVRDRGLVLKVDFVGATVEVTIYDRHSAESTQLTAGAKLDGLPQFFELCRRQSKLYEDNGVMTGEELRKSLRAAIDELRDDETALETVQSHGRERELAGVGTETFDLVDETPAPWPPGEPFPRGSAK